MDIKKIHCYLGKEFIGKRIDISLALKSELSRNCIQNLIKDNNIILEKNPNKILRSGDILKTESNFIILQQIINPEIISKSKQTFRVVYEDEHLMVIDKPSSIVTHPGCGNKENTLVNQLISYTDQLSNIGGIDRLGIVHRLDKETSGLMIVAKTNKAHQILSQNIQTHAIDRKYYALVWGIVKNSSGIINVNLGRSKKCFKKVFAFDNPNTGKTALTHYRLLKIYKNTFSSVECTLQTGRTHQIRVHMNYIKHPVVGDALYGNNSKKISRYTNGDVKNYLSQLQRHILHSKYIQFQHPISGKKLFFSSKLPENIEFLIQLLEK